MSHRLGTEPILRYPARLLRIRILAGLLLLAWCAQGASLGHFHYIPDETTPAFTKITTITGEDGLPQQKSHRDGSRDTNCPLCMLSVHLATLVVPQQILLTFDRQPQFSLPTDLLRSVYTLHRSHHWSGRAPPR